MTHLQSVTQALVRPLVPVIIIRSHLTWLNDIGPNCLVNKTYDYTKADWSKISESLSNVHWSDDFGLYSNGDELWFGYLSALFCSITAKCMCHQLSTLGLKDQTKLLTQLRSGKSFLSRPLHGGFRGSMELYSYKLNIIC